MNERFHAFIGEMADNESLTPSHRRLLIDHTDRHDILLSPQRRACEQRDLAACHDDECIALIEAGDADAAASLAVAHWELCRADFESFVTPLESRFPWVARRSHPSDEKLHEARGQRPSTLEGMEGPGSE